MNSRGKNKILYFMQKIAENIQILLCLWYHNRSFEMIYFKGWKKKKIKTEII